MPLEEDELIDLPDFINELKNGLNLTRDSSCRFAYTNEQSEYKFYINGCEWETDGASQNLLSYIANNRHLAPQSLNTYLHTVQNQLFIYNLWKLQWLHVSEN
jgi:50S ribosomal protein L16 3-hydroxylase